jgi:hypothetical protein
MYTKPFYFTAPNNDVRYFASVDGAEKAANRVVKDEPIPVYRIGFYFPVALVKPKGTASKAA